MNAGAKIIVSDTNNRDGKKSDGCFTDFPNKIKGWVEKINITNKSSRSEVMLDYPARRVRS